MKIFIFDSESFVNEKGNPEFGLAVAKEFNHNNFIYFYSKDDVKEWLTHGEPKHVYIHNGLKFDLELIFGYHDLLNYNLIFSNGKLYHAIINKSHIFDSYLLIPKSLKKIGIDLGLVKGELQKELAIIKKDEFYKRINEIEKYCENDVIILENGLNWLFNFINEYGIEKYYKYLTIASLSFSLISKQANLRLSLHKSKNKNIKVINPMHNLFLLSYFGGRTEAFFNGIYNGQIYTYDFNSLYPSCFFYSFPNKFLFAKTNVKENDLKTILLDEYEGLGFFEIDAPKGVFGFYDNEKFIDIGLLPYKDKKQNKIIYPVGHFYGWYNFNEIRYAIAHGYKIKAITLYVFDKILYHDIYHVINQFYKLRKTDSKNSYLYKLMINSFYGKFGEKHQNEIYIAPEKEKDLIYDYDHYKYITEIDNDNNIKYIIVKDLKYTLSNHTDFSIASYITSYARIQLLKKFEEIIQNNGKIYYCDTDSIFTNILINSNNELGNIKLEYEGIKLILKGQKNYKIFTKNGEIIEKMKGIPKDASLINTLNNDNDEIEIYEYNHILPFKSGIKKYNELTNEKVIKKIKNTYKREKGKGFLYALELNSPNVLINENIKWKFNNLKEFFDYVNIYYPYKENFKILYS
ncbi:MAG: DNA polymerase [Candidatus Micrarchaeaceae archaeon]